MDAEREARVQAEQRRASEHVSKQRSEQAVARQIESHGLVPGPVPTPRVPTLEAQWSPMPEQKPVSWPEPPTRKGLPPPAAPYWPMRPASWPHRPAVIETAGARVHKLEARVDALEARNRELESQLAALKRRDR